MSSPKVPPRFVPTLTDVVPVHADMAPAPLPEPVARESAEGPQEPSAWAQDGLPPAPRRGVVSLPASLPPLPPGLAPQFPLAEELAPPRFAEEPAVQPPAMAYAPPVPETWSDTVPDAFPETLPGVLPEPVLAAQPLASAEMPLPPGPAPSVSDAMDGLWEVHAQKVTEEYLVHRLMQRVDLVLDQRLREAIATVVQEQTRSIVVRLREEVESVVRQAVYEAVADELAQQAKTARDN